MDTNVLYYGSLRSAERQAVRLGAWVEELDLDEALVDRVRLADELIQALVGQRAVARLVDVETVRRARRLAIEQHPETHGCSSGCRAHDQVGIAGLEPERDTPAALVQHRGVLRDRPVADGRPLVEPESRWLGIEVRLKARIVG